MASIAMPLQLLLWTTSSSLPIATVQHPVLLQYIDSTMNLGLAFATLVSLGASSAGAFVVRPTDVAPRSSSISSALGMSAGGKIGCSPVGIGSAAPPTRITNDDLESVVETSDEWIRTRTGIGSRHVLQHGEKLNALSTEAARKALDMAGVDPKDIGVVICASSSADDMFGDATVIAAELQCTNAAAFDLVAACSGFLFATVTAGQFLQNGAVKHALVIGADALSRWVDWDDRNSCILFGDAAGAMVLSASGDSPGVLGYSMNSNGGGYCDLNAPYVSYRAMCVYCCWLSVRYLMSLSSSPSIHQICWCTSSCRNTWRRNDTKCWCIRKSGNEWKEGVHFCYKRSPYSD